MSAEQEYRVEKDSMGEVRVPADAKWRAQTQRAVENFPISGRTDRARADRGAGRHQGRVGHGPRQEGGCSTPTRPTAIHEAAAEVARGDWDAEFPIDVFQTGSGTSSNMNTNEVLATLAAEQLGSSVHPNDDVNDPFSSNDQFPAAIHIAATQAISADLIPALTHLAEALEERATEFESVVKSGRTHLMDATPVTLGQEFAGYAAADALRRRAAAGRAAARRRAAPGRHRGRHRHQRPGRARRRGHRRRWPTTSACRSPRPATTSRRRARATRWSRPAACCAPSPSG